MRKSCGSNGNQKRIMRRDLVKLSRDARPDAKRGDKADYQPEQNRIHPLFHHESQNICDLSAERHAHSDFGDLAVRPCKRPRRKFRRSRATTQQRQTRRAIHRQPLLTERLPNDYVERVWLQNWHFLVDLVERAANDRLRSVLGFIEGAHRGR